MNSKCVYTSLTYHSKRFNLFRHQIIRDIACDSKKNRLIDTIGCSRTGPITEKIQSNLLEKNSIIQSNQPIDLSKTPNQQKMAKSKYEYIREHEEYLDKCLIPDSYIVIRVDGSRFHLFSTAHYYVKPNDKRALDLMNEAALYVIKHYFPNIICAYGQSDEYSFVISKKSVLFNRRSNKLNSMLVSAFTSAFIFNWPKYFGCPIDRQTNSTFKIPLTDNQSNGQSNNENTPNVFNEFIELKYPPTFDSRCVLYTDENEIKDYLKWRQVDCHINNLYNTTFYALTGKYARWYWEAERWKAEIVEFNKDTSLSPQEAEKRLRGTISKQKRDDVLRGMFNIEYENEMEQFRRGSFIMFEKKDERLFDEYQKCLLTRKKKQLDKFNLDDFINFQILHQELIQSDYLDNYFNKIDFFIK